MISKRLITKQSISGLTRKKNARRVGVRAFNVVGGPAIKPPTATDLHYACLQGNLPEVLSLLHRSGDKIMDLLLGNRNGLQQIALHVAASCGHKDVVKSLLEYPLPDNHDPAAVRRTQVQSIDIKGNFPLNEALKNAHEDVVVELLQHHPPLGKANHHEELPLHFLAKNCGKFSDANIQRIVLGHRKDHGTVNCQNSDGEVPLLLAVENNNSAIIHSLLENGADLEQVGEGTGEHPFHRAARLDNAESVMAIARFAPEILELQTHGGFTGVHLAAQLGRYKTIDALIQIQANIDVTMGPNLGATKYSYEDTRGATPLMLAMSEGHQEMVVNLLRNGARAEARDACGRGALHYAAVRGIVPNEAVIWTIKMGLLDVQARDRLGRTILHIAAENNHGEFVKFLLDRQEIPSIWKESPRGLTVCDMFGMNPLHVAVARKCEDACKSLLDCGFDVAAKTQNDQAQTALDIAIVVGDPVLVELFLLKGADPHDALDAIDRKGITVNQTILAPVILLSLKIPRKRLFRPSKPDGSKASRWRQKLEKVDEGLWRKLHLRPPWG